MQSKASSFTTLALLVLAGGILAGSALATTLITDYPTDGDIKKQRAAVAVTGSLESKPVNQRLLFINDMAREFGITPQIVADVDKYARQFVDASQPEWRLIQTPEFMTHLMLSIIYVESKGKPGAVGDGGRARGLTQIWVSTAQQYDQVTAQELLDPDVNLRLSFEHFHYLLRRYRGNVAMALYSWNRGQGTVDRLLSYGQSPANGYGRRIYRASLAAGAAGLNTGD